MDFMSGRDLAERFFFPEQLEHNFCLEFRRKVPTRYHVLVLNLPPLSCPIFRVHYIRIVIDPEVDRENRRNHSARWCQLPGVSDECSLTHPGKNPVPFNVECRGLYSQIQEVNCHRWQPVLIRLPSIMLGRTGKHVSDAAGKALDVFPTQFIRPQRRICRFH